MHRPQKWTPVLRQDDARIGLLGRLRAQPLLGRVSATLTTAMYGMRPLGALAGGLAAEYGGLEAAIGLPVVLFGLSTLAILASPMPRLKAMPEEELTPRAAG